MPNDEFDEIEEEEEIEEEQEDAEMPETEDEEVNVPITYTLDDGTEITEQIPYDKLVQMVADSKKPSKDAEYIRSVQPLVSAVKDSDMLQEYFKYRQAGYSDEQIKKGWYIKLNQKDEDEEYDPNKELKDKVLHLETKLQNVEMNNEGEKYMSHNAALLEQASLKYGKDIPDNIIMDKVAKTFQTVYPNIDLKRYPLTEEQVNIIVKEALSGVKVNKTAANVTKQITIPKVLPSRSATKVEKMHSNVVYGNADERANAFSQLIK